MLRFLLAVDGSWNSSRAADWLIKQLAWLKQFKRPSRQTFITHGEPDAADAMRRHVEEGLGWRTAVPEYRETIAL